MTKKKTETESTTTKKSVAKAKKPDKIADKVAGNVANKIADKVADKIDIKTLRVSLTDIGYMLGMTTSAAGHLAQSQTIVADPDGKYPLMSTVSKYCKALREKKADKPSKNSIDVELSIWKLQNLKMKNRDWRQQRDREVALEIVRTLNNAMLELREQAKMNPALVDAFDKMIESIGRINIDSISLAVEGNEEDDDE